VKRAALIATSTSRCLCLAAGLWIVAPPALTSCASGADDIPTPITGDDAGKTGSGSSSGATIPFPEEAGSSEDDAGNAEDTGSGFSDDAGDDSGFEDDSASNNTPDVTNGGEDAPSSDDTGVIDTGTSEDTGSGTVACGGVPAWFEGTTALEVQNFGIKYHCMVEGWCSQTGVAAVDAWEPGTGSAWQSAWTSEGPCSAGGDE
jgi:hypothetical protein